MLGNSFIYNTPSFKGNVLYIVAAVLFMFGFKCLLYNLNVYKHDFDIRSWGVYLKHGGSRGPRSDHRVRDRLSRESTRDLEA